MSRLSVLEHGHMCEALRRKIDQLTRTVAGNVAGPVLLSCAAESIVFWYRGDVDQAVEDFRRLVHKLKDACDRAAAVES